MYINTHHRPFEPIVWRVWLCIQGQITYNCLNFYSLRSSIMLNNEPISVFILYVNRVNNPHSQCCVVLNAKRILQLCQKREDIPCNSQTNTLSYPSFWTFVADYNHRKALSLLLSLLLCPSTRFTFRSFTGSRVKQNRQITYKVTLRQVLAPTVAVEKL